MSTQVLREFYVVTTRKLKTPVSAERAARAQGAQGGGSGVADRPGCGRAVAGLHVGHVGDVGADVARP